MFVQVQRVAFRFKMSESNRVHHITLRLGPEHLLVERDLAFLITVLHFSVSALSNTASFSEGQLTADDRITFRVDTMDLENRPRGIQTDCRDFLAPPNRGGLNSTHIHGTHVLVEEGPQHQQRTHDS